MCVSKSERTERTKKKYSSGSTGTISLGASFLFVYVCVTLLVPYGPKRIVFVFPKTTDDPSM